MSLLNLIADSRHKTPGSALQGVHSFGVSLIVIPVSESPPWQHVPIWNSLQALYTGYAAAILCPRCKHYFESSRRLFSFPWCRHSIPSLLCPTAVMKTANSQKPLNCSAVCSKQLLVLTPHRLVISHLRTSGFFSWNSAGGRRCSSHHGKIV